MALDFYTAAARSAAGDSQLLKQASEFCFRAAAVAALLAVILFIVLDIKTVFRIKTGSSRRKLIREMEKKNSSGRSSVKKVTLSLLAIGFSLYVMTAVGQVDSVEAEEVMPFRQAASVEISLVMPSRQAEPMERDWRTVLNAVKSSSASPAEGSSKGSTGSLKEPESATAGKIGSEASTGRSGASKDIGSEASTETSEAAKESGAGASTGRSVTTKDTGSEASTGRSVTTRDTGSEASTGRSGASKDIGAEASTGTSEAAKEPGTEASTGRSGASKDIGSEASTGRSEAAKEPGTGASTGRPGASKDIGAEASTGTSEAAKESGSEASAGRPGTAKDTGSKASAGRSGVSKDIGSEASTETSEAAKEPGSEASTDTSGSTRDDDFTASKGTSESAGNSSDESETEKPVLTKIVVKAQGNDGKKEFSIGGHGGEMSMEGAAKDYNVTLYGKDYPDEGFSGLRLAEFILEPVGNSGKTLKASVPFGPHSGSSEEARQLQAAKSRDWMLLSGEDGLFSEAKGDGRYKLHINVIDFDGNRSDTSTILLTIDRTAPEISVSLAGSAKMAGWSSWRRADNCAVEVRIKDENPDKFKIRIGSKVEVTEQNADQKWISKDEKDGVTVITIPAEKTAQNKDGEIEVFVNASDLASLETHFLKEVGNGMTGKKDADGNMASAAFILDTSPPQIRVEHQAAEGKEAYLYSDSEDGRDLALYTAGSVSSMIRVTDQCGNEKAALPEKQIQALVYQKEAGSGRYEKHEVSGKFVEGSSGEEWRAEFPTGIQEEGSYYFAVQVIDRAGNIARSGKNTDTDSPDSESGGQSGAVQENDGNDLKECREILAKKGICDCRKRISTSVFPALTSDAEGLFTIVIDRTPPMLDLSYESKATAYLYRGGSAAGTKEKDGQNDEDADGSTGQNSGSNGNTDGGSGYKSPAIDAYFSGSVYAAAELGSEENLDQERLFFIVYLSDFEGASVTEERIEFREGQKKAGYTGKKDGRYVFALFGTDKAGNAAAVSERLTTFSVEKESVEGKDPGAVQGCGTGYDARFALTVDTTPPEAEILYKATSNNIYLYEEQQVKSVDETGGTHGPSVSAIGNRRIVPSVTVIDKNALDSAELELLEFRGSTASQLACGKKKFRDGGSCSGNSVLKASDIHSLDGESVCGFFALRGTDRAGNAVKVRESFGGNAKVVSKGKQKSASSSTDGTGESGTDGTGESKTEGDAESGTGGTVESGTGGTAESETEGDAESGTGGTVESETEGDAESGTEGTAGPQGGQGTSHDSSSGATSNSSDRSSDSSGSMAGRNSASGWYVGRYLLVVDQLSPVVTLNYTPGKNGNKICLYLEKRDEGIPGITAYFNGEITPSVKIIERGAIDPERLEVFEHVSKGGVSQKGRKLSFECGEAESSGIVGEEREVSGLTRLKADGIFAFYTVSGTDRAGNPISVREDTVTDLKRIIKKGGDAAAISSPASAADRKVDVEEPVYISHLLFVIDKTPPEINLTYSSDACAYIYVDREDSSGEGGTEQPSAGGSSTSTDKNSQSEGNASPQTSEGSSTSTNKNSQSEENASLQTSEGSSTSAGSNNEKTSSNAGSVSGSSLNDAKDGQGHFYAFLSKTTVLKAEVVNKGENIDPARLFYSCAAGEGKAIKKALWESGENGVTIRAEQEGEYVCSVWGEDKAGNAAAVTESFSGSTKNRTGLSSLNGSGLIKRTAGCRDSYEPRFTIIIDKTVPKIVLEYKNTTVPAGSGSSVAESGTESRVLRTATKEAAESGEEDRVLQKGAKATDKNGKEKNAICYLYADRGEVFDGDGNVADGLSAYVSGRTDVTLCLEEENPDFGRVYYTRSSRKAGESSWNVENVRSWKKKGRSFSPVSASEDGEYRFGAYGTDRAGNPADVVERFAAGSRINRKSAPAGCRTSLTSKEKGKSYEPLFTIVIDTIAPEYRFSVNQPENLEDVFDSAEYREIVYYGKSCSAINAVYAVEELNFDEEKILSDIISISYAGRKQESETSGSLTLQSTGVGTQGGTKESGIAAAKEGTAGSKESTDDSRQGTAGSKEGTGKSSSGTSGVEKKSYTGESKESGAFGKSEKTGESEKIGETEKSRESEGRTQQDEGSVSTSLWAIEPAWEAPARKCTGTTIRDGRTRAVFSMSVEAVAQNEGKYRFEIAGCDKAGNLLVPGAQELKKNNSGSLAAKAAKTSENRSGSGEYLSGTKVIDVTAPTGVLKVFSEANTPCETEECCYEFRYDTDANRPLQYNPFQKASGARAVITSGDLSPTRISCSLRSLDTQKDAAYQKANPLVSGGSSGWKAQNSLNVEMKGEQVFYFEKIIIKDRAGNVRVNESGSNFTMERSEKIYLDATSPVISRYADAEAPQVKIIASGSFTRHEADGERYIYRPTGKTLDLQVSVNDPGGEGRSSGLNRVIVKVTAGDIDITDKVITEKIPYEWESGTAGSAQTAGSTAGTAAAGNSTAKSGTGGKSTAGSARTANSAASANSTSGMIYEINNGIIRIPTEDFAQSNDITVRVEAADNSGNYSEASRDGGLIRLGIDTVGPRVEVNFRDTVQPRNERYFAGDRTVEIVVIDRNMDSGKIRIQTNISVPEEFKAPHENIEADKNGEKGDEDRWTKTLVYDRDGDYTLDLDGTDALGNGITDIKWNGPAPHAFTIDKTRPVISIFLRNTDVRNGKYYNKPQTAEVTITERNFRPEEVSMELTAGARGDDPDPERPGLPTFSAETGSHPEAHTAVIEYKEDGYYSISVNYTDPAGNRAEEAVCGEFVVDLTPPVLLFDRNGPFILSETAGTAAGSIIDNKSEIPAESASESESENTGESASESESENTSQKHVERDPRLTECIPVDDLVYTEGNFRPAVHVEDTYADRENCVFEAKGTGKGAKIRGEVFNEEENRSFDLCMPEFEVRKSFDDVYHVRVSSVDLAGNRSEEIRFRFSLNRFGSTFEEGDTGGQKADLENSPTYAYIHRYFNNRTEAPLSIREINPVEITEYDIFMVKDGFSRVLKEGVEFQRSTEKEQEADHRYKYEIFENVFAAEGDYSFVITTRDRAGNENSTGQVMSEEEESGRPSVEAFPIAFSIDKTAPENRITGVEASERQFRGESLDFNVHPEDSQSGIWSVELRFWSDPRENGRTTEGKEPERTIYYNFMDDGEEEDETHRNLANLLERRMESDEESRSVGNGGITIPVHLEEQSSWQIMEVVTIDRAGNESIDCRGKGLYMVDGAPKQLPDNRRRFLVSTNPLVQFIGSISFPETVLIGTAVILLLIIIYEQIRAGRFFRQSDAGTP